MKTSDHINELAAALAKAQGEMKPAPKDSTNPHFKSKFADLATCMTTALPVLSKHGLSLIQATQTDERGILLVTRLAHASGQWVEATWPLPAAAKPQEMGSALTYGRRYTLAIIGLVTDEDDDAEQASGRGPQPGGINPRSDTSHVDRRAVTQYVERIANVKADDSIDDLARGRRLYEIHSELCEDEGFYTVVADELARVGVFSKAKWKEIVNANRPQRRAS